MKLQHWSVRSRPWGQLQSPEKDGICLYGRVMGHARHADGKEVLTSPVAARRDNHVVTKSGSEYDLAEPDPDYEHLYPKARQRLFAKLAER